MARRIFTELEERQLSNFMGHASVGPGHFFIDRSFTACVMQAFLSQHQTDSETPDFNPLNGFVQDFK
jgi:hypothetical protein